MVNTIEIRELLANKEVSNLGEVAQWAVADREILQEILAGVVDKDDTYRHHCFQVLLQVSDTAPSALYPDWDYFVELLSSPNAFHRSIAVQIIAGLSRADADKRFDAVFERYFALLDDEKVMVARHLVQNAWKIVEAKPYLQVQITARLLEIDKTHHPKGRKDLIKGDLVELFGHDFEASQQQEQIRAFAEQQLASESPKTRKAAADFVKRYGR
jgi:hypothetical protein